MFADAPLEVRDLSGGVKYIRVANFEDRSMAEEFLDLIDSIDDETTTGLLFDLRFTLGGRGDVAETMVGALIDNPVSRARTPAAHSLGGRRSIVRSG